MALETTGGLWLLRAIAGLFRKPPRSEERDRAAADFRDELQRIRETFVAPDPEEVLDPLPIAARQAAVDVQRAVARFRDFAPPGVARDTLLRAEREFLEFADQAFAYVRGSAILPFAAIPNADEQRQQLAGFMDRLRECAPH